MCCGIVLVCVRVALDCVGGDVGHVGRGVSRKREAGAEEKGVYQPVVVLNIPPWPPLTQLSTVQ